MIRFVTLLVGLVTGAQGLEIAVSGPVARVELRVDGMTVAERRVEPWLLRHDFGRQPRPALLEAVAFDVAGRELGRDRQWVNLAGRRAEAAVLPELDAAGRVAAARITWRSPERGEPRRVRAAIDGERVEVAFPWRIDLTGFAADERHLLEVELDFGRDLVLRRQLAFGGDFSGEHATGLTAVAVELVGAEDLPSPDALTGWFSAGDEPLEGVAVERGPAEVVVVRHGSVDEALARLERERRRDGRRHGGGPRPDTLPADSSLWLMLAEPVVGDARAGQASLHFPVSERPTRGSQGLLAAALSAGGERMIAATQHLGNAVALAGLEATRDGRRRAVVVLLGRDAPDSSFLAPDAVRAFLADLTVPLEVWDMTAGEERPQAFLEEPVVHLEALGVRILARIRRDAAQELLPLGAEVEPAGVHRQRTAGKRLAAGEGEDRGGRPPA